MMLKAPERFKAKHGRLVFGSSKKTCISTHCSQDATIDSEAKINHEALKWRHHEQPTPSRTSPDMAKKT